MCDNDIATNGAAIESTTSRHSNGIRFYLLELNSEQFIRTNPYNAIG